MEVVIILLLIFIILTGYYFLQAQKLSQENSKLEKLQKKILLAHQEKLNELKQIHMDLYDEIEVSAQRNSFLLRRISEQQSINQNLSLRIAELSKFESILDIKTKAQAHCNFTIAESQKLFLQIQSKILELNNKVKDLTNGIREEAIDNAQNVAAEAYALKGQESELKKVIKALENKISGYGDEYLIPVSSTLDDLVEQYGHLDASNKLTDLKQQIKNAILTGEIADCDYAEPYRRKTAIDFVSDAFNGKAASNLARLKYDNVGKLIQTLKDDYVLVNNNGKAFRNAHIKQSYLLLRIQELQWAAIVLEYREREREEQREIREQIREEERARKEYEKAIKEAAKEEATLMRAYEKAKREYELASDIDKAKYEAFINDLNEKLKLAEEKNQRALSMAQQTKAGHVYVISNIGSFGDNVLKLGMTRRFVVV